jgi:hypothetical protein
MLHKELWNIEHHTDDTEHEIEVNVLILSQLINIFIELFKKLPENCTLWVSVRIWSDWVKNSNRQLSPTLQWKLVILLVRFRIVNNLRIYIIGTLTRIFLVFCYILALVAPIYLLNSTAFLSLHQLLQPVLEYLEGFTCTVHVRDLHGNSESSRSKTDLHYSFILHNIHTSL